MPPSKEEIILSLEFYIKEAAIANASNFRSAPENMLSANIQLYIGGSCTGYLISKSNRIFSQAGALYEIIAFSDEYKDQEASFEWELPKITKWHTAFYMWLQPSGSVSFIHWQKLGKAIDVTNIIIDPILNFKKILDASQEKVTNYRGEFEFYRTMLQIEGSSNFCKLSDIDSKLPSANDFSSIIGQCSGYNIVVSERNFSHPGKLYEAIAFSKEPQDQEPLFDSDWVYKIDTWHTAFYMWLQPSGSVSCIHWPKPGQDIDLTNIIIDSRLNVNDIISRDKLQTGPNYRG